MNNADNIPTEEIKQDIADTEAEIAQLKREIYSKVLINDPIKNLLYMNKIHGIRDREKFVEKLKNILISRGEFKIEVEPIFIGGCI